MSERAEITVTQGELRVRSERKPPIILMPDVAVALQENTEQLGAYLVQMAQIMHIMQKRLDELEEKQKAVTVDHQEVKTIQQLIRMRADEYCEKYGLEEPKDAGKIRAAIKKSILQRYGIKDLHDVPVIARQAVEAQISRWADIKIVLRIREKHREDGA